MVGRQHGGRSSGRRWDRRLRCLAHTSHNASGRHPPRPGDEGHGLWKVGARRPCGGAGLMSMMWLFAAMLLRVPPKPFNCSGLRHMRRCTVAGNCPLWGGRSQRRSDGRRRLRGTGSARAGLETTGRVESAGPVMESARPAVESGALTVVVHAHVVVPAVVAVVTHVRDLEAGEEDGRDDEDDARHDHDPRRETVEPIRFDRHGRRLGGDGGRPGWDFRCFTHTWNDAGTTARAG